jgi:hypothetical protein
VFTPNPQIQEGFEVQGPNGAKFIVPDLVEYFDDEGNRTVVGPMHEYDENGIFVDVHEVVVPSKITEAREAVFAFTERHRKAFKIGAAAITTTVAVGSLIIYGKHRRSR